MEGRGGEGHCTTRRLLVNLQLVGPPLIANRDQSDALGGANRFLLLNELISNLLIFCLGKLQTEFTFYLLAVRFHYVAVLSSLTDLSGDSDSAI